MSGIDVVGDVHGCRDELLELLEKLGYDQLWYQPGRHLVFLGDLIDRGPHSADVLEMVMQAVADGHASCILGNHDWKLLKLLNKEDQTSMGVSLGLMETHYQMKHRGPIFIEEVRQFLGSLKTIWETDDLLVVHGAYREGLSAGKSRDMNLYGETCGRKDEEGYRVRLDNWKHDYTGEKTIVVGHQPLYRGDRAVNHKIISAGGASVFCIDWGACYGGDLAAYRWPEDYIYSVPSRKAYKVSKGALVNRDFWDRQ